MMRSSFIADQFSLVGVSLAGLYRIVPTVLASLLLSLPFLVFGTGCAEQEVELCFPPVLSDHVRCVEVPSGTQCSLQALSGIVTCIDKDNNVSYPEPYNRE